MVAPATLVLRPLAGPATTRASLPKRTSRLLPPTSLSLHRAAAAARGSLSLSVTRAVAMDTNQAGSAQPEHQEKPGRYYFVVANAKFMLDEEEHFQEQLCEKLRLYEERSKEQDFWLVVEPKFLDNFPNITKRLKRPAVALVSTDGRWITFMKLRLDRVLSDSFKAGSLEEALASTPVDLQFGKPDKWVAPYPKYATGWWKPFLPPESSKTTAL